MIFLVEEFLGKNNGCYHADYAQLLLRYSLRLAPAHISIFSAFGLKKVRREDRICRTIRFTLSKFFAVAPLGLFLRWQNMYRLPYL